jgi:hypothetical protein
MTASVTDLVWVGENLEFTYRFSFDPDGLQVAFNIARGAIEVRFWDVDGQLLDLRRVGLMMIDKSPGGDKSRLERKCKVPVPIGARTLSVYYERLKIDGIEIPPGRTG